MIYLNGDNSLETSAIDDLEEMEAAGGSDSNVNVVAMADGLNKLTLATLDAQGEIVLDPNTTGGTFRFCLTGDMNPVYVLMRSPVADMPYLGERNMGDPDELEGFITWARQNFPANKYALILWDHGGGCVVCPSRFGFRKAPAGDPS